MKNFHKIIILIIFFILWIFITQKHFVKPIFLPPLQDVIYSFKETVFTLEGLKNILFTLKRTIIGFFIAIIISVPLGILFGVFKKIYNNQLQIQTLLMSESTLNPLSTKLVLRL